MEKQQFKTIDDYIATFPPETQLRLEAIRSVIKAAAPEAVEKISYQMPTFFQQGNLIHFAAFKNHIGLYPAPSGIETFEKKLAEYKHAKGSVQFLHNKPLPLDLIREITEFRVSEKQAEKKK